MPPIFKTIASISVWILFINGVVATLVAPLARIIGGESFGQLVLWIISIICLFLTVCAIKLRQMLQ